MLKTTIIQANGLCALCCVFRREGGSVLCCQRHMGHLTSLIRWLMLSPVSVSTVSISALWVLVFALGARISASYMAMSPLLHWRFTFIVQCSTYLSSLVTLNISERSKRCAKILKRKRVVLLLLELKYNPVSLVTDRMYCRWDHLSCTIIMPYRKLKPHVIFMFESVRSAVLS